MSETPDNCTHPIWEPCRLHPVDCENCMHADVCRMRETFQAYPDQIKRCRFFRAKKGRRR